MPFAAVGRSKLVYLLHVFIEMHYDSYTSNFKNLWHSQCIHWTFKVICQRSILLVQHTCWLFCLIDFKHKVHATSVFAFLR